MSGNLLKIIFTVLGLLAISVSIWFIAPLLGFDDLLIVLPSYPVRLGPRWRDLGCGRVEPQEESQGHRGEHRGQRSR